MRNKRGFELAISTLVVIILAMLLLIGLTIAFTGGFKNFWDKIKGYSGSEIDNLVKMCKSQCNLDFQQDYCCQTKILNNKNITCEDSRIKSDCTLDCTAINCAQDG